MYLIDTSVWAEILLGSQIGKNAKEMLHENECFALDITFAELSKWCVSNNFNPHTIQDFVERSCNGVLGASKKGFIFAGLLWRTANNPAIKGSQAGLMDCIVAAAAHENGFVVLTKDRHFEKFESVKAEFV